MKRVIVGSICVFSLSLVMVIAWGADTGLAEQRAQEK